MMIILDLKSLYVSTLKSINLKVSTLRIIDLQIKHSYGFYSFLH